MNLVISEILQTAAVMVVALVVFTGAALFLKAESATWNPPEDEPVS